MQMDLRVKRLSDLILDYSIEIKEGQTVVVSTTAGAEELVQELSAGCAARGAWLLTLLRVEDGQYLFFRNARDNLLDAVSPVELKIFETVDALVSIMCNANSRELSRVDPQKIARHGRGRAPIYEIFDRREKEGSFKWTIAPYPVSAMASDAEMSLTEYSDFVFKACGCNENDPTAFWRAVHAEQEKIVQRFNGSRELHITGPETDLRMSVAGRSWVNCSGKYNMPDGEIFTSPVEDSANGRIYFDYPAFYRGVEVKGVRLTLKDGRVTEAGAEKGEDYLLKLLDTDANSRFLGEIAIGTNFNITSPTKSILFDEKIGGSMHMAVGRSIPETGGKNMSALHWDLIKDLRDGGRWQLDGQTVYENGKFTI